MVSESACHVCLQQAHHTIRGLMPRPAHPCWAGRSCALMPGVPDAQHQLPSAEGGRSWVKGMACG